MVTLNTFRDIIATIVFESGTHVQKEFPTFFLTMLNNEWISLSLKKAFGF
jgi:hypothetical protein